MKRVSPDTIQFEKLHPYVFCDSYRLPKGPTGKYRLTFTTPEGMTIHFSVLILSLTRRTDAKQFRESFYRIGMA